MGDQRPLTEPADRATRRRLWQRGTASMLVMTVVLTTYRVTASRTPLSTGLTTALACTLGGLLGIGIVHVGRYGLPVRRSGRNPPPRW